MTEFFGRLELPTTSNQTGVVEFQIEDEKTYRLDLGQGKVDRKAKGPAPEIIVRARALDFMALVEGRMSFEDGLLTERLHVAGDMLKITHVMGVLRMTQPNA